MIFLDVILQAGEFMANSFIMLWSAIGTWGIFGLAIIAPVIIRKIGHLLKMIFQF